MNTTEESTGRLYTLSLAHRTNLAANLCLQLVWHRLCRDRCLHSRPVRQLCANWQVRCSGEVIRDRRFRMPTVTGDSPL